MSVIAARQVGNKEFGAFSLALALYLFLLWVARSFTTQPFVIRLTMAAAPDQRSGAGDATAAAVAFGMASGLVVSLAALAVGAPYRWILVALAVSLPALLLQDAYRYVLFTQNRHRAAAGNDGTWLVVQLLGALVLIAGDDASAAHLMWAFGVGAWSAAIVGARQTKVIPHMPSAWRWVRDHRDLGVPFFFELALVAGMMQVTLFVVAAIGDVTAVSELRTAQLMFGPLTMLFWGALALALPAAVRVLGHSRDALGKMMAALALATVTLTAAWGIVLVALPSEVGPALLGSNWAPGRRLVLPQTAWVAATACASVAALVGLRALQAGRRSLRARLRAAPALLVGGAAGTKLGGAYGAAAGLALATFVDAVVVWIAFRRALAAESPHAGRPPPVNEDPVAVRPGTDPLAS